MYMLPGAAMHVAMRVGPAAWKVRLLASACVLLRCKAAAEVNDLDTVVAVEVEPQLSVWATPFVRTTLTDPGFVAALVEGVRCLKRFDPEGVAKSNKNGGACSGLPVLHAPCNDACVVTCT